MPDKQKIVPDDHFVDYAWSEMRKLLDEQMPTDLPQQQQSSKRRLAFLWWLLGAGVVATGLWWAVHTSSTDNAIALGNLPIEQAGTFDSAIAEVESIGEQQQEEANAAKANKTNESRPAQPGGNKSTVRLPSTITDLTESHKVGTTTLIGVAELPEKAIATEEQSFQATLEEENIIATDREETWALAPVIAGLSPNIEEKAEASTLNHPFPVKRAGRRFLSLELQGLTSRESWLTGAGLNILADVKLGNNGWALQTGLGVEWQKRPIEVYAYDGQLYSYSYLTNNADELGLEIDSTMIDAESIPTTNYDELVSEIALTAQTFYLNMPVKISKQVGDRWSVFAGVNVGYLLKAIDRSGSPDNEFTIVNGPGSFDAQNAVYFDTNVALRSKTSAFEPAFLNRWQLMALGGVQYKITPRMDVGIAYRHHFSGLIKDIEINRGVGQGYLSLMYRL